MSDTKLKLVLLRGGPANITEVLLDSGGVTIGRSSNNQVILQDTKVSRYHAEVSRAGSDWIVKDLESANGVRVNGARVVTRVLAPDDLVAIGETEFRVDRCTPVDVEHLQSAPPPVVPPDPAGVGQRRTVRTPALDEPSLDREPIGVLGSPPAPVVDQSVESTVAPNRLVAAWAQPQAIPGAVPGPPPNPTSKPRPDASWGPIAPATMPGPTMPAAVGGAPPGLALATMPPGPPGPISAPGTVTPATPPATGRLELLEPQRRVTPGAELAGLDAFQEWVMRRAAVFDPSSRALRLRAPSAIALVGPAGCGKASAVRGAAAVWGLPYARLHLPYLLSTRPSAWTAALSEALARLPLAASVLAFEDVDVVGERLDTLGEEAGRAWHAALELLAGWLRAKEGAPLVMLTARDPRRLPPSLVTRGEAVDEVFFVDLPGHRARQQIVEHGLRLRGLSISGLAPDALVDATAGYSAAQVHHALEEALFAHAGNGRDLTTADLADPLRRARPAAQRLGTQLDELREWARLEARSAS